MCPWYASRLWPEDALHSSFRCVQQGRVALLFGSQGVICQPLSLLSLCILIQDAPAHSKFMFVQSCSAVWSAAVTLYCKSRQASEQHVLCLWVQGTMQSAGWNFNVKRLTA